MFFGHHTCVFEAWSHDVHEVGQAGCLVGPESAWLLQHHYTRALLLLFYVHAYLSATCMQCSGGSPMTGVTDDHELLCGYWDLNLHGSFGTEPSLWPGEVLIVGSGD